RSSSWTASPKCSPRERDGSKSQIPSHKSQTDPLAGCLRFGSWDLVLGSLPMRRRAGFTITELLVAMALIVFILSILATAFSEARKPFAGVKGIGDMNQRLRTASALLRSDLEADHFGGRRRLSDTHFWTMGPPREGFFRIWQGGALLPTTNPPNYADPLF